MQSHVPAHDPQETVVTRAFGTSPGYGRVEGTCGHSHEGIYRMGFDLSALVGKTITCPGKNLG